MRWTRVVAVTAACLVVASCGGRPSGIPTDPGRGVLTGSVGPGVPPDGGVPARIDLAFTRAGQTVTAVAVDGEYEVELPAGTWDVRSSDGLACALGVTVSGASRQRQPLTYPGECFDASGPPPPPGPAAPPSP